MDKLQNKFKIKIFFCLLFLCYSCTFPSCSQNKQNSTKEKIELFVLSSQCDSITINIPKIDNKKLIETLGSLMQIVKEKDLIRLKVHISDSIRFGSEIFGKYNFLKYWGLNSDNQSLNNTIFWQYLEGMLSMQGAMQDSFSYLTPAYSFIVSDSCNLENRMIVKQQANIYRTPSVKSDVLCKVSINSLIDIDLQKTVIPYKKYEQLKLFFPIQEEFDSDVWYYSVRHKGYINAIDVWSIYYGSVLLLRYENGIWKMREFILFD